MKKPQSTAITEQEYLDYFNEDITVRRRNELKAKIDRRIENLNWNLFDISGDGDFDLERLKKQSSEEFFDCDGTLICYEIDDYEECLLVKFLWDDEYLNDTIRKIEQSEEAELMEAKQYKQDIVDAAKALSSLPLAQQKLFFSKGFTFLGQVVAKMNETKKSKK